MKQEYLFHASSISGITTLKAWSKLRAQHGPGQNVVYLTENLPYSLIYIWDEQRNQYGGKYVTCGMKDGIARYIETFPDQLRALYQGVSGYLYCVEKKEEFQPVCGWESMYYSCADVPVAKAVFIEDVYEELLRYEREGAFEVCRYADLSEEKREEMMQHNVSCILRGKMWEDQPIKAAFYQKHFPTEWQRAAEIAGEGRER